MKLNRLLLVYLSALTLLLLSVIASLVFTEIEAEGLVEDAAKINIAGRQRMLSQRIIYLSQDLSISQGVATGRTKAELQYAIDELQSAVHLFETSHGTLSQNADHEGDTYDLYFGSDTAEPALDERIKAYLSHARGILRDPTDQASLQGLLIIERAGLLQALDDVVSHIEQASVSRVSLLRKLERWSLMLAIFIVLVEVLFVFIPGHRFLQRTLARLKDKNTALKRALDGSETLRKEQAEFTYAVSHDLKSPANSIGLIIGEVLIEESDRLSADGREMLVQAHATVDRIGGQVEDILEYAWATTGEKEVHKINLNDCLGTIAQDLRHDIEMMSAQLSIDADVDMFGYPQQIKMLLQNLISNALKFHEPDAEPKITITANTLPNNEGTLIVVEDNGIGIAKEDQEQIFKMFRKLHLREKFAGTGLGLATCKRIVDNHNGSIQVTSDLLKGARFSVVLRCPDVLDAGVPARLAA